MRWGALRSLARQSDSVPTSNVVWDRKCAVGSRFLT
jgi:hypothetical protein